MNYIRPLEAKPSVDPSAKTALGRPYKTNTDDDTYDPSDVKTFPSKKRPPKTRPDKTTIDDTDDKRPPKTPNGICSTARILKIYFAFQDPMGQILKIVFLSGMANGPLIMCLHLFGFHMRGLLRCMDHIQLDFQVNRLDFQVNRFNRAH